MCVHEHDNYDSQEYYDDSKYDEMVDDFFMMENDLDKEDFVKRYGQSTYDKMMEIYLSKKDKRCQD